MIRSHSVVLVLFLTFYNRLIAEYHRKTQAKLNGTSSQLIFSMEFFFGCFFRARARIEWVWKLKVKTMKTCANANYSVEIHRQWIIAQWIIKSIRKQWLKTYPVFRQKSMFLNLVQHVLQTQNQPSKKKTTTTTKNKWIRDIDTKSEIDNERRYVLISRNHLRRSLDSPV